MRRYDKLGSIIGTIEEDTTDWNAWFDSDKIEIKKKYKALVGEKEKLNKIIKLKQKTGKLYCNLSISALKYDRTRYDILKDELRIWPKNTVVKRVMFYINDEYAIPQLRSVKIPEEVNKLWLDCLKINTDYKAMHRLKSQLLIDAMMLQVSQIKKKNPDFVWDNHPKNINAHLKQITDYMKVSLSDFIRKAVIYPYIEKYKDTKESMNLV